MDDIVEWKLRVSIPDGLIAAVNLNDMSGSRNDIVLWSHKFESPVAAVWMLHGSYLKSVDLFSEDVMPDLRDGIPDDGASTRLLKNIGELIIVVLNRVLKCDVTKKEFGFNIICQFV